MELPAFAGLQISVAIGSAQRKHCVWHARVKGDTSSAKDSVKRSDGASKIRFLPPWRSLGAGQISLSSFLKYLMKAKFSVQSYSVLHTHFKICLGTVFEMSLLLCWGVLLASHPFQWGKAGSSLLWSHSICTYLHQSIHCVYLLYYTAPAAQLWEKTSTLDLCKRDP